eukprot:357564_1
MSSPPPTPSNASYVPCAARSSFYHRKHFLNLLFVSDLLIFLATLSWMEFSQSVFNNTHSSLDLFYEISPLALFTHNCDSYHTYIWILLFNLSTITAISVIALCIYAVHQTSFEPTCIVFLILTLIAFVTVSAFPIIAFISFCKLSIFALSSLVQSNMNIVPALYSPEALIPVTEILNNPRSDSFHQRLYQFVYPKTQRRSFDWNTLITMCVT